MQVYNFLVQKMELLNKIAHNTETQLRFVRRQEMRGLQRLLRERAKYLHQLTMLNASMQICACETPTAVLETLQQQIVDKQQQILSCNAQTLQEAKTQRDVIAASLKSLRQRRHLDNSYQLRGYYAAGGCFRKQV